MNEENENKTETIGVKGLIPKTIRCESEHLELFAKVKASMQETFPVVNDTMVFGEVMERYFMPIKQNGEAENLRQELEAAHGEVERLKAELEAAHAAANQNAEAANQQQLAHEQQLAEMNATLEAKNLKEGEHVVKFRPGYYEVLERVAEIEGKRRNQPWTADDVICFFVFARFVKGQLNGNLQSLPDSECRKIEQQLGISLDPKRKAAPSQKKEVEL